MLTYCKLDVKYIYAIYVLCASVDCVRRRHRIYAYARSATREAAAGCTSIPYNYVYVDTYTCTRHVSATFET